MEGRYQILLALGLGLQILSWSQEQAHRRSNVASLSATSARARRQRGNLAAAARARTPQAALGMHLHTRRTIHVPILEGACAFRRLHPNACQLRAALGVCLVAAHPQPKRRDALADLRRVVAAAVGDAVPPPPNRGGPPGAQRRMGRPPATGQPLNSLEIFTTSRCGWAVAAHIKRPDGTGLDGPSNERADDLGAAGHEPGGSTHADLCVHLCTKLCLRVSTCV